MTLEDGNIKITVKNPMPFVIGDVAQHVDRVCRDQGVTVTKEVEAAIMSFTDSIFLNRFIETVRREAFESGAKAQREIDSDLVFEEFNKQLSAPLARLEDI